MLQAVCLPDGPKNGISGSNVYRFVRVLRRANLGRNGFGNKTNQG
ncbi:MAG: hypothetical protein AAGF89_08295 [Bacteroidota bacterium]